MQKLENLLEHVQLLIKDLLMDILRYQEYKIQKNYGSLQKQQYVNLLKNVEM